VSNLNNVCECGQLVIPNDLKVGGNDGIVEIYAPNLILQQEKLILFINKYA